MNSDKQALSSLNYRTGGNALIYILLALALLGALTMLLGRQNDSGENTDAEKAEILTTSMVAYAGTAKNTVDQMMMSGTNISNLVYLAPNHVSFDTTGLAINKVYHPSGGGLSYSLPDPAVFTGTSTVPVPGWYMGRFNNTAWTITASNDIMLAAFGISKGVCASINKKITGTADIPAIAGTGNPATYFVDATLTGVPNAAFTNTICAPCEGYPSMCVSSGGASYFTYYNIISGQ